MRGRRIGFGIGAAVIVLAGAGAILAVHLAAERAGDPALPVERYLDAVATGDEAEANRLADPAQTVREQMVDGLLAQASERIEVESVETASRDEDGATVSATFTLDGVEYRRDFSLDRTPGGFLRPDEWELETSLVGALGISAHAPLGRLGYEPELRVAGREVEMQTYPEGERAVSFFGYPAVYEVTLSSSDYFAGVETETALQPEGAASGGDLWLDLAIEPRERLESELLEQGDELAAGCAEERSLVFGDGDPATVCPRLTDLRTAEACNAKLPDLGPATIDGLTVSCAPYPELVPFGPSVRSERAGDELRLQASGSVDYALSLGPYRFVDADSGAETVQYLAYAEVSWRDGAPLLESGDFAEEWPEAR